MNNNSILIEQIKDSWKGKLFCCPFNECGSGLSNYGTDVSLYPSDEGLVQCICPKCNNIWFLCRKCVNLRKAVHPLLSYEAIHNHNYRLHKECNKQNSKKKRKQVQDEHSYGADLSFNVASNKSCKDTADKRSEVLEADNYGPEEYVLADESDIQEYEYDEDYDVFSDHDESEFNATSSVIVSLRFQNDATLQNDYMSSDKIDNFCFTKYKNSICNNPVVNDKLFLHQCNKNMLQNPIFRH